MSPLLIRAGKCRWFSYAQFVKIQARITILSKSISYNPTRLKEYSPDFLSLQFGVEPTLTETGVTATLAVDPPAPGQFISLYNDDYLHIREIMAWGLSVCAENVPLSKACVCETSSGEYSRIL